MLLPTPAPLLQRAALLDRYGRAVRHLRISVTDRCNQRCVYCLPEKARVGARALPFDDLFRLSRVAVDLGITKIRLSGGEPLLRRGVVEFLRKISSLPGVSDVSLTTNAVLLDDQAKTLRQAGLKRINVSLDSLQRGRYARLTRRDDFEAAWRGYQAALREGFQPLKVNCVVMRGVNDDEIFDFAALAARDGVCVRFIEFMPMGQIPWNRDSVVTGADLLRRLSTRFTLRRITAESPHSPTRQLYEIAGTAGRVGFINSVSEPFCESCSRLRITAKGGVRPCLLNDFEIDLKPLPRTDAALIERIRRAIEAKPVGHTINDEHAPRVQKPMAEVGG